MHACSSRSRSSRSSRRIGQLVFLSKVWFSSCTACPPALNPKRVAAAKSNKTPDWILAVVLWKVAKFWNSDRFWKKKHYAEIPIMELSSMSTICLFVGWPESLSKVWQLAYWFSMFSIVKLEEFLSLNILRKFIVKRLSRTQEGARINGDGIKQI